MTERLIAYVDGFNLYNGLHDKARCELLWLDLVALVERLRPRSKVVTVRYFTAPVLGSRSALQRQNTYQSALKALHQDRIDIVQGRYQTRTVTCRSCGASYPRREEKETDVSIAVSLVSDSARQLMDTALLISADSDLVPAVKAAKLMRPSLTVIAAFPPKRYSAELDRLMPSSFHIAPSRIRASFLPAQVIDEAGRVHRRPEKWSPTGP